MFIRPNSATKGEFAKVRVIVRNGAKAARAERARCERYGMPGAVHPSFSKKGRTGALRVQVTRTGVGGPNGRLSQSENGDAVSGQSDRQYAHLMGEGRD